MSTPLDVCINTQGEISSLPPSLFSGTPLSLGWLFMYVYSSNQPCTWNWKTSDYVHNMLSDNFPGHAIPQALAIWHIPPTDSLCSADRDMQGKHQTRNVKYSTYILHAKVFKWNARLGCKYIYTLVTCAYVHVHATVFPWRLFYAHSPTPQTPLSTYISTTELSAHVTHCNRIQPR